MVATPDGDALDASVKALRKTAAVVSSYIKGGMSSTSSCLEKPVTMTGVNHEKEMYLARQEATEQGKSKKKQPVKE